MDPYGKKRKSFFSKGRDFESSSKQKREEDRARFRSSTSTLSVFHDNQRHQLHHASRSQAWHHKNHSQSLLSFHQEEQDNREEGIDELASKLFDDTTAEQLGAHPGRRLSQICLHPGNSGMSTPLAFGSNDNTVARNLPQPSSILLNEDDAWALKGSPVVISSNCTDFMQFVDEPDTTLLAPPNILTSTSAHPRNSSAPAIPRKSSQRKSKRPKSNIASPKKPSYGRGAHSRKLSKSISTPVLLSGTSNNNNVGLEINDKIANMLAATAALKGPPPQNDGMLLRGPLVAPKKKIDKENNAFFAKMKSLGGIFRKRRNSLHDLLVDTPVITDGEIRLNEGKNLERRGKTANLTGRRKINIARKPIAEDGKSLKSRKSNDKESPFVGRPSLSSCRMTTNDLDDCRWGLSDGDEDIELDEDVDNDSTDELMTSELPPMPRNLATMPNLMTRLASDFAYTRSNSLLSSPPVDESTPRLRLEPFTKNGKTTLKSVPVEFHSFFDPDASIGSPSSRLNVHQDPIINHFEDDLSPDELAIAPKPRRASKLGYHDFDFVSSTPRKKHPSPTKDILDGWAVNIPSLAGGLAFDAELPESCVLAPRDPNRVSCYSEHSHKSAIGPSHQSVRSLTRVSTHRQSVGSITGSPRRNSRHSIIGSSNRSSRAFGMDNASALEIDELQDPVYDNHRKRI